MRAVGGLGYKHAGPSLLQICPLIARTEMLTVFLIFFSQRNFKLGSKKDHKDVYGFDSSVSQSAPSPWHGGKRW